MSKVVVFDLGGVMARICHSWPEAIEVSGIRTTVPLDSLGGLTSLSEFDDYQAGAIDLETYTAVLGKHLGCSAEDALHIHNSILIREYDGIKEIVDDLIRGGILTGCLSNTNDPHWKELTETDRFDSIRRLECKMASHLVGYNKPDSRIYNAFCADFDILPEQIVYFDDLQKNVDGAIEAGFRAHRIDPEQETAPQIRAILIRERVL